MMVGKNNTSAQLEHQENDENDENNETTSTPNKSSHYNMSNDCTTTTTTSTTNNNNHDSEHANGNGEDDAHEELRIHLFNIITTIRVKLDFIEAEVEQVNTLEELNHKKYFLNVLQEITRILAAFPRSDGYEAKELPESFSGKPRLIAFRNNMNFMLWENNSKLHLINDYVTSTEAVNKLSLVLNVVNPIKDALEIIGDYSHIEPSSPRLGGVGDTGSIVAHLNEFAERRWAERGRQILRPARYSATTFAGSSRKFMEKMRLQVDYTLESLHSSGNLEESFLFESPTPLGTLGTRFARSPSVSSIPVPSKPKTFGRREASNIHLPRFALSPFTPDYSRPGGWSSSPRGHVPVSSATFANTTLSLPQPSPVPISRPQLSTKGPSPTDILRRSNSFSSPSVSRSTSIKLDSTFNTSPSLTAKSTPSSPSGSPPESPNILRSASLSKDFSQTVLDAHEPTAPFQSYPSSPPPSPVTESPSLKRNMPKLESLRLDHSSSTISSNSPSPTSSFRGSLEFNITPGEDDREDPFDYRSVQNLPSFNVDPTPRPTPTSPHPTSSSLPSRFSYALLSPTLPPHPYPAFPRQKQRTSMAVNEQTFKKLSESESANPPVPAKAELDRTESDRLLRRSSSDNIRAPSVRTRYPATPDSDGATPVAPPSPGSRLKFEMDAKFGEVRLQKSEATTTTPAHKPRTPPSPSFSTSDIMAESSGIRPKDHNSPISPNSSQPNRRFMQQHRKRNMSISFAFRQLLGKGDRSTAVSSNPAMGKVEEAIMSRAASFKSDWLCPILMSPGYRIDMGSTNSVELPTCMNVMDLDLDISYYSNEFFGTEHYNFLGTLRGANAMPGKPVGVSMKFVKGAEKFGEVTALVRTIERDERFTITFQPNLLSTSNTPSRKRLIKLLQKRVPKLKEAQLEEIRDPKLNSDFERFEAQLRVTKYKFGVLYCAEGQVEENDMYSNVTPSSDFAEFLQVIGTSVELQGWKSFRGGLDVKTNTTGTHSVYTLWNDYEIMFHVAPLLPYDAADEQRVERKRHIGNDIVVLIFKDGPSPINPAVFKSHFNHVFMVVQKDHAKSDIIPHYRVSFACKDEVPVFGPMYPHSYSFPNTPKFREFILTKLVNAERAAMHTPVFFSKTKRTRQELLQGFSSLYATGKDKK